MDRRGPGAARDLAPTMSRDCPLVFPGKPAAPRAPRGRAPGHWRWRKAGPGPRGSRRAGLPRSEHPPRAPAPPRATARLARRRPCAAAHPHAASPRAYPPRAPGSLGSSGGGHRRAGALGWTRGGWTRGGGHAGGGEHLPRGGPGCHLRTSGRSNRADTRQPPGRHRAGTGPLHDCAAPRPPVKLGGLQPGTHRPNPPRSALPARRRRSGREPATGRWPA